MTTSTKCVLCDVNHFLSVIVLEKVHPILLCFTAIVLKFPTGYSSNDLLLCSAEESRVLNDVMVSKLFYFYVKLQEYVHVYGFHEILSYRLKKNEIYGS